MRRRSSGEYKFGLRVDDNGDLETGPGDLQGFFDGTLEVPLMSDGEATAVDLTATRLDLDFGLGRLE